MMQTETKRDPDLSLDTDTKERLCPMYRVLIHNDPVTPMNIVVAVLRLIFRLETARAHEIMMEAHSTGVALVKVETLEQAEFHIEQAHSMARGSGYPLTLSMEPEE